MGGLVATTGPDTQTMAWRTSDRIGRISGSVNLFLLTHGWVTAAFDNIYQGQFGANSINSDHIRSTDTLYICGAYIGLNDGTTNDPQQRFVSRLLVSGLGGGENVPTHTNLQLWPNPSVALVAGLEELPPSAVLIVMRWEGSGRQPVRSHSTTFDLHRERWLLL